MYVAMYESRDTDPASVSLSVLAFGVRHRERLDGKLIRAHGWLDDEPLRGITRNM